MNNSKKENNRGRNKNKSTFRVKNSNVRLNGTVPDKSVVQPFQQTKQLLYYELSSPYNNSGNLSVIANLQITNAYDENSAILSNSTQYLSYMGTLYARAKVVGVDTRATVSNLEQYAMDVGLFVSPNNLATSFGSRSACEAMLAGGTCVNRTTMSEQYGKRSQVTLRYRCHPGDILGSRLTYDAGDEFAFDPSSSGPAAPIYLVVGVFSPYSTMPNGFLLKLTISLVIRFYELKPLSTFLLKEAPKGAKPFLTVLEGEVKREDSDDPQQADGRPRDPLDMTAQPLFPGFEKLSPLEQNQILDIVRQKVTRSKTK